MINILVDILGWTGAATLLVAYWLVSTRKLEGDSFVFQFLNLAGSALLIVNSFYYGAYPSVAVNFVWIGIALFALARKKSSSRQKQQIQDSVVK